MRGAIQQNEHRLHQNPVRRPELVFHRDEGQEEKEQIFDAFDRAHSKDHDPEVLLRSLIDLAGHSSLAARGGDKIAPTIELCRRILFQTDLLIEDGRNGGMSPTHHVAILKSRAVSTKLDQDLTSLVHRGVSTRALKDIIDIYALGRRYHHDLFHKVFDGLHHRADSIRASDLVSISRSGAQLRIPDSDVTKQVGDLVKQHLPLFSRNERANLALSLVALDLNADAIRLIEASRALSQQKLGALFAYDEVTACYVLGINPAGYVKKIADKLAPRPPQTRYAVAINRVGDILDNLGCNTERFESIDGRSVPLIASAMGRRAAFLIDDPTTRVVTPHSSHRTMGLWLTEQVLRARNLDVVWITPVELLEATPSEIRHKLIEGISGSRGRHE